MDLLMPSPPLSPAESCDSAGGGLSLPRRSTWRLLPYLLGGLAFALQPVRANERKLGDMDGDGVATVRDIARIAGHFNGTSPLPAADLPFADINRDGTVNDTDMDELVKEILGTREPATLPLASVRSVSPADGEGEVAVTRETIVHFTMPLALSAALDTTKFKAEFGGKKILSRAEISSDRSKATLFYLEPLPSNARVQVSLNGTGLTDLLGRPLDLDADGVPGGVWSGSFDTLSITPVAATAISGRVIASERATGGNETPLAGVTVTVDGAEQTLRTVTDAQGNFTLSPCPAGSFFVQVDGRTSPQSSYPEGNYYPTVGKRWEAEAGRADNLSGNSSDPERGTVYLPLIRSGTMQATSPVTDTTVTFPASAVAADPRLVGTRVDVPANALFSDSGLRGGRVGIAPVAPDRLPSPLPPGLDFPLVITIQTDGATNFDRPVPVTFPNLPDPATGETLPPGAKSALWSFNHDTGDWEVVGPMTVTDDGLFVKTDPGVGVLQPGWHGGRQGSSGDSDGNYPGQSPCNGMRMHQADLVNRTAKVAHDAALFASVATHNVVVTLGVSTPLKWLNGYSILRSAYDCYQKNFGPYDPDSTFAQRFGPCLSSVSGVAGIVAIAFPPAGGVALALNAISTAFDAYNLNNDIAELEKTRGRLAQAVIECAEAGGYTPAEISTIITKIPPPVAPEMAVAAAQIAGAVSDVSNAINDLRSDEESIDKLRDHTEPGPDGKPDPSGPPPTDEETERVLKKVQTLANAMQNLVTTTPRAADVIESKAKEASNGVRELQSTIDRVVRERQRRPGGRTGNGNDSPCSGDHESYCLVASNSPPGTVQRFKIAAGRRFSRVLAPLSSYRISVYDPVCGRIGSVLFVSAPNGGSTQFPPMVLVDDLGEDADADGLSDEAEHIIGTSRTNPDTDGDGISDGVEVRQGTNPLDGLAVATGVIASAPTGGPAKDIATLNNIAVTANGATGITLFNVLAGLNPLRLKEISTPGTALAVAIQGQRVAVADYAAGLALIDISDPSTASISHQVNLGSAVTSVTTYGPVAIAGTISGSVFAVDSLTGIILWHVPSTQGRVQDLAVAGETLYVYRLGRVEVIPLASGTPGIAGSVTFPTGAGSGTRRRLRLSVGPGVLYAAHTSGWQVIDIATNPLAPVLAQQSTTPQLGFKQLVSTGSTLAVAAAGSNTTDDGPHEIDLYDTGIDGRANSFLTTFTTPGLAEAVSIYNGLAYVADGEKGMQVVNYRAYDNQGLAPAITLTSNFNLTGGTAEAGTVMRLTASVTDDVQVRNVEFHVDGVLQVIDGNFPFEHRLVTPRLTAEKTSFTVRARATDTGGNAAWSEEYTLELVPDATPPVVRGFHPAPGSLSGALSTVAVIFSEPMDPGTLSSGGLRLLSAGADGVPGTADDEPVGGTSLDFSPETNTAYLALSSPLSPGRYRLEAAPPAADAAGNVLASASAANFKIFSFQDSDGDGVPDDWEIELGLNPAVPDSNNNGIRDGQEDYDGDGVKNAAEIVLGFSPKISDSDGNGIPDGLEDRDTDGLTDAQEILRGTDPLNPDTDSDLFNDEVEISGGSDPLDPTSRPVKASGSVTAVSIGVIRPGVSPGPFAPGAIIATPPVQVVRPAAEVGTVIASPPVKVDNR